MLLGFLQVGQTTFTVQFLSCLLWQPAQYASVFEHAPRLQVKIITPSVASVRRSSLQMTQVASRSLPELESPQVLGPIGCLPLAISPNVPLNLLNLPDLLLNLLS
jgi:hypothetical protein